MDSDFNDSTHTDAENAERRALAEDADARTNGYSPLIIDESEATDRVRDLCAEGTVDAIPEEELLVHIPTETTFKSDQALAYFHEGWSARNA